MNPVRHAIGIWGYMQIPLSFQMGPSSVGPLVEGSSFYILRPFPEVSASVASLMNAFWLGQEAQQHNGANISLLPFKS